MACDLISAEWETYNLGFWFHYLRNNWKRCFSSCLYYLSSYFYVWVTYGHFALILLINFLLLFFDFGVNYIKAIYCLQQKAINNLYFILLNNQLYQYYFLFKNYVNAFSSEMANEMATNNAIHWTIKCCRYQRLN